MSGIFWNDYPYTDFHELNLTWVIKKVIELNETMKDFVSTNTIKYADPIQWDISKQYEANTVVIDPNTGIAYISARPVPSGVAITDSNYWNVIFDLSAILGDLETMIVSAISNYNEGDNINFSHNIASGTLFWWKGALYITTSDVIIGNDIATNSGIYSVSQRIADLVASIQSNATAITSLEDTIVQVISSDNEGDNVTFSTGYSKDELIWWNGRIYKVNSNVNAGDPISGNVTLTTLADEILNSYGNLEFFRDKKILIAGDSLSNETVSPPNWVEHFRSIVSNVNCTVENISFGGSSWADGSAPNSGMGYAILQKDLSAYDILIIEEGTNDCTGQIPLGSWSTTSGRTTFIGTIWEVFGHVASNNPDLDVYWVIPPKRVLSNTDYPTPIPLNVYRSAISNMCNYFNWKLIDWNCGLSNLNPSNGAIKTHSMPDGLHISSTFAPYVASYMIQKLISGGDVSIGNGVQDQAEYTSFDSANVSGVLRFLYDTKGNIEIEFQLTVSNLSGATKLISLSDDSAPVYAPFMIASASRNFYSLQYITDGWYIVPYGTVASDTIIGQLTISLDKIKPKGSWSL